MNLSDRDKKLLVYLAALLLLAASYFFVGRPYLEKIDQLGIDKIELESTLAAKKSAFERQGEFQQGIEQARNDIGLIIARFPEDNSDEKSIMFVVNAENEVPMWISQVTFAEDTQSLINGDTMEENTESASEAADAELADQVAEAEGEETGGDVNVTGPEASAESGSYTGVNDLTARNTGLGIAFQADYKGFKEFLAYIRDYKDRMVITNINVSYGEDTGMVSGNVNLSQYALLGEGRELPDVVTEVNDLGKSNIFENDGSMLFGSDDSVSGDNYGNEDYFIKLNATNDNVEGKTIGKADDVPGSSYLLSSKNSVEDVNFTLSGTEGGYKVVYSIGKTRYEDELLNVGMDEVIVVRVVSTERQGDDDNVGINLHATNDSDITMVINIEGDDSSNPRVNIQEKNGDIIVNK